MSRTTTDSRQVVNRTLLEVIANKTGFSGSADNKPADTTELKNLLSAINSELKVPYYLSESTTPDLILNVASATQQNTETNLNRTHQQTPDNFAGGTIEFPSADGGAVTVTPGTNTTLSLTAGNFKKVLIQIDESGQLSIKQGAEAASEALAEVPLVDGRNVGIGYVVMQNDGGTIQNVENSNIYQFVSPIKNLSLTVQEIDGAPVVNEVVNIKFPNDTVTDDGDGNVTVDLSGSVSVVNDQGDAKLKLKPRITNFTLQSPDSTVWGFTVNEEGLVVSESGSLNPPLALKVLRDDGQEASFRVDNTGLLQVVSPADAGTSLVDNIFLEAPDGTAWELRVTTTAANFIMASPNGTLYEVGISDLGELETTEVSTGEPQNIKIRRDDETEVGLTVNDDGILETQNPPQVGAILKASIYLASPDETIWELNIDNDDVIYTTTDTTVGVVNKSVIYTSDNLTKNNIFQITNDKDEVMFSVKEFEEVDTSDTLQTGAYLEVPVLNLNQLESIEIPSLSSSLVTAECYLDTGSGLRRVFFDTFDSEWKFCHDLSLVFP